MAKKRSVSTSRADREDDKRKRDSNKAENKRNSRKRDAALIGLGAAGAVAGRAAGRAAKSALNKPPTPMRLYRANQQIGLKEMQKMLPGKSKEDILRMNRKGSVDLARAGMIQKKGTTVRGAKGTGYGSGLRKDDIRTSIQRARKGQGMGASRYARLTGGGGAPGLGRGQGGRGGGGGFLSRGK